VCVCVHVPHFNLWTSSLIFTNFGMNVMPLQLVTCFLLAICLAYSLILKMEAVHFYHTTQCYITEDSTLHLFKSFIHSSELFPWIRCMKFWFEPSTLKIKDDFIISCKNFVLLHVKFIVH
jgi:hypothetical protein